MAKILSNGMYDKMNRPFFLFDWPASIRHILMSQQQHELTYSVASPRVKAPTCFWSV